jgi:PIN domain nuclease of toxin-antitoxin system
MKILLDTHMLLWALLDEKRVPHSARNWITNPRNTVLVSAASVWEIAVKHALGKLKVQLLDFEDAMVACNMTPLSVTMRHAIEVSNLPLYHRDPFDRLLIAQCIVETAQLVTHDSQLKQYGKVVLAV